MRGSDPDGKSGPQKSLPDTVTVIEPKEEAPIGQPSSQDYGPKADAARAAATQAQETVAVEQTSVEASPEDAPEYVPEYVPPPPVVDDSGW